jgi:hypothetical protein
MAMESLNDAQRPNPSVYGIKNRHSFLPLSLADFVQLSSFDLSKKCACYGNVKQLAAG